MKESETSGISNHFVKGYLDLKDEQLELKDRISALEAENATLRTDFLTLKEATYQSQRELQHLSSQYQIALNEIQQLKAFHPHDTNQKQKNQIEHQQHQQEQQEQHKQQLNIASSQSATSLKRSIPAPSKTLVDNRRKRDNRLLELRRITQQAMQVSEEEAKLRLHKLQKAMVHIVADLKKYMQQNKESTIKSWKTIDVNTQRIAFDLVEKEAASIGVPLTMCIGYWGARRLISKSWANALRTTRKQAKLRPGLKENDDLRENSEHESTEANTEGIAEAAVLVETDKPAEEQ